jgi:hypothetical protein
MVGATSAQRPASHTAIGRRKIELANSETAKDATRSDPKSGTNVDLLRTGMCVCQTGLSGRAG